MHKSIPSGRLSGPPDDLRGLDAAEVERRLARYGPNDIVETVAGGWRDVLADTIRDPMLWFLAATSLLFAIVADYAEAITMAVAIVPLVGMDAFLHRRTQASTQGLSSRLADRATVIRDGASIDVPARALVPGDLAIVRSGEPFPADGLIVGGESLHTDESTLTGESFPVRKAAVGGVLPLHEEEPIDTVHWGFAGTRLLTGEARFRVISTGADTLYGEIVRSATAGVHARTPLQQSIANLVRGLLVVAAVLCLGLAWIRLHQGNGLVDALVSAVTLAVAAIPEEFPIVFTFFLGIGVFRLARRQALVRRAVVVENIGRVTCICSDKTGTLTEGRIHVTHYVPAEPGDRDALRQVAALASRADSGDPLDAAILAGGDASLAQFERIATYPFTEDRRRETAVFKAPEGATLVATKGAPETILPLCEIGDNERASWQREIESFAGSGHKVIACASLVIADGGWTGAEPAAGYRFAGLLACEDPIRDGVVEAARQAMDAGIRVVMVTGDHPVTAIAVAREIGIGGERPHVVDGSGLDAAIEDSAALENLDIVARAVPSQKLSLVRALQARGEIVAVTGDGVNDVPALQAADIGIAMGDRGTRSAREVGAIVLLDDNFRTIVSAIGEGRQLFRNLRLSFAYLLMVHIPLVASATLIPLAGYPLLYLPIHIVWLELIIHPTALLVFQELPTGSRLLPTGRGARDGRFFSPWEWIVVCAVGSVVTLIVVWGYDRSLGTAGNVEHARAMAMVALVIVSAGLTASLSGLRTRTAIIVTAASAMSAVILVQLPAIAGTLHLEPLHLDDWLIAGISGLLPGLLAALFRWRGPDLERNDEPLSRAR